MHRKKTRKILKKLRNISKSKTHAIYKIKSLKVCMQIRKLRWFFIACEIHKAARDVDNNTRKYLLYVWYLRMWTHSNMLCWRWKYLYSNKRNPMAVIEAGWPGLYQWRWYWPPGWCTPRGRSPSGSSCSGTVCNIAAVRAADNKEIVSVAGWVKCDG